MQSDVTGERCNNAPPAVGRESSYAQNGVHMKWHVCTHQLEMSCGAAGMFDTKVYVQGSTLCCSIFASSGLLSVRVFTGSNVGLV